MEDKATLPFIWLWVIALWIGVLRRWKHKRKVCTESTEATVIKIEKDYDSEWEKTETPIFGYTVDWKEYKWTLTTVYNRRKFRVWDKRMILYNPKNPKDFIDWNWWSYWTICVWMIIIWIILIVAAFSDI